MRKSKYRRWTKEEDRKLKRLYQKKTSYELGEIFDRKPSKVCKRASRLGIKKDKDVCDRHVSIALKKGFAEGRIARPFKERNPNWKGGRPFNYGGVGSRVYNLIHKWLRLHYGNATKCENKNCPKISKNYQWAKIQGKKYERKRENFWMLCKSCHAKYDIHKKL